MIESKKDELSKIIYKKIKENRGFSDSEMESDYEQLPIPVSDNFYVKSNGIGFFYNPYSITHYANGSDDVFISFDEIKDLLSENIFDK